MASLVLPQQTRLDIVSNLCASAGLLGSIVIGCYQVSLNVTDQTSLADVTGANECNFDGYARSATIDFGPDVFYATGGIATIYGQMVNFQSAADQTKPQSIFGVFYVEPFSALTAPTAPAAALAAGGSLTVGTEYFYVITALEGAQESVASAEVHATPTTGNQEITLTWTAVTGATGYKVYRGTVTGTENLLVATVMPGSTVTWTDTGTETGSSATPPVNPPTSILRGVMALDTPVPIVNYPDGLPFLPSFVFAG